jgi:hypothetical protein
MHTARARFAAKLHPRIGIAYMHHSHARKQAVAQQTDRACVSGVLKSAINCQRRHTPVNPVAAVYELYAARAPLNSKAAPTHRKCTCAIATHENKPRHSKRIARAAKGLGCAQLGNQLPAPPHLRIWWQLCTQHAPAEQQSCNRASESRRRTITTHENKPRHSKRIARAAKGLGCA